ncbi:LOW QUALITY PROTEIN: succinate dehydrogenase cytochrome b560 subunit, mitochondrial-like [Chelonus insularis]|uniref:LOW QUALITY PROTEIN: succinate dehydrogenase cytochrome b560 subunit, mitochondrial-like n=1 Tax=Chelonus insularis TaxID=460826 RepID=UPI001589BCE5|nr:LOW QUALITY PROTEIN: succinate dehydrogenase cytochrome b560 subunit, mitochondrial-like [Chelonus insularis]
MTFIDSAPRISSTLLRGVTTPVCETHAEKNERLKRPMSPHLTIYKPQLTSVLSITHRGTGMALAFYAIGAGLTELFVPGGVNLFIDSFHALCLPVPIVFLTKFAIAWPAMYHFFNGIRHLAWDIGIFLSMNHVYKTGWTMLGTSVVTALIISAIF